MGKKEGVSLIPDKLLRAFPNISREGYLITSQESPDYNCFAWAMGDKSQWWSPIEKKGYYWRVGVPRTLAIKTFAELYKLEGGYLPCDNAALEPGFEKIAFYADEHGNVKHTSKQLPSGKWTSKLGDWEDIEHGTLEALEGRFYGKAVQILKRAIT